MDRSSPPRPSPNRARRWPWLVAAAAILTFGTANVFYPAAYADSLSFGAMFWRAQRIVESRFDRARYDSEQTAAAFAERLRIEVDLDAVASNLTGSVEHVLRPRSLGLWLKAPDR